MTGIYTGKTTLGTGLGLLAPAKVMDLELTDPIPDLCGLDRYRSVRLLVRNAGAPIGVLTLPVINGQCSSHDIGACLVDRLSNELLRNLVRAQLSDPLPLAGLEIDDLWSPVVTPPQPGSASLVTVAVCTRDRTESLSRCLDALELLDYPNVQLLVVDNAPSTDRTHQLVSGRGPRVQYSVEHRPGLDWARNRAIALAQGEIIAFTDDDVMVDRDWVSRIVDAFNCSPSVMAVTGLIVPFELETDPQILFEIAGGFGRGYRRFWYQRNTRASARDYRHVGAGQFGAGANMAFRLALFNKVGGFDPALDVGTSTEGGGDLEMFFRIVQEGHLLVYEPKAVVRHRHRRSYREVRDQLGTWGTAVTAYLSRCILAYPRLTFPILRFLCWWLFTAYLEPLVRGVTSPQRFPRDLIITPLTRACFGPVRYWQSRLAALRGGYSPIGVGERHDEANSESEHSRSGRGPDATAVRWVDVSQPIQTISDVKSYSATRVCVTNGDRFLDHFDVQNEFCSIPADRIRDLIAETFPEKLLRLSHQANPRETSTKFIAALSRRYLIDDNPVDCLQPTALISVVIATYDRPDYLRRCLDSMLVQTWFDRAEIIVVDNRPDSYQTREVVASFPSVRLVNEARRGLAFARNAGINAASGTFVVTTDDDVVAPANWLENLVRPMARRDVSAVTGNVLPLTLDTQAERCFEKYGGLGRGSERFEIGPDWFRSRWLRAVPMWNVGATANAVFRKDVFTDQEVGLLDESLGPGTPTGGGEDCYLFYKIAKAGHTILYEPSAYVCHSHRSQLAALERQIYAYSKGHVAYLLTTLFRDADLRSLFRLLVVLPSWHAVRLLGLAGLPNDYPRRLIVQEILGYVVGPISLVRSLIRVWRLRALVGPTTDDLIPSREK